MSSAGPWRVGATFQRNKAVVVLNSLPLPLSLTETLNNMLVIKKLPELPDIIDWIWKGQAFSFLSSQLPKLKNTQRFLSSLLGHPTAAEGAACCMALPDHVSLGVDSAHDSPFAVLRGWEIQLELHLFCSLASQAPVYGPAEDPFWPQTNWGLLKCLQGCERTHRSVWFCSFRCFLEPQNPF